MESRKRKNINKDLNESNESSDMVTKNIQMSNTKDLEEKLTLLIEEETIVCSKNLLLNNSDYFKAMLTGNFLEKDKKIINLKGIKPKVMQHLIGLLDEPELFSLNDDIYSILSACSMYLFENLKSWIISRIEEELTLSNCLQTWLELEALAISPLCWKAKSMSLMNFEKLVQNKTIHTLSLTELCNYLGHVNLQCDSERSVLNAALLWYHKQFDKQTFDHVNILEQLLVCIDFRHASLQDVIEMKNHLRTTCDNESILKILEFIIHIKSNVEILACERDENYSTALKLTQSKARYLPSLPCLLMKQDECRNLMAEVVCYDKYGRKRHQKIIGEKSADTFVYFDPACDSFKEFSLMATDDFKNLTGFGMQNYKGRILIFGGEFSLGRGCWNRKTWSLDVIRDKLEQKLCMPSPRRHFESCVCGHYLYVLGGTGAYRVIYDNMLCFDIESERWTEDVLPCSGRQIKCCNYDNRLFLFSVSEKCGYFYHRDKAVWEKIAIDDPLGLIRNMTTVFSVFFYNDYLFLKGDQIVELKLSNGRFEIVRTKSLPHLYNGDFFETLTCNNYCYTLYKHKDMFDQQNEKISLECLDLDNLEMKLVSENVHTSIKNFGSVVKLFSFHHHNLVAHNTLVNSNV